MIGAAELEYRGDDTRAPDPVTCADERAANARDLRGRHDHDVRQRGACRRCGSKELIAARRPERDYDGRARTIGKRSRPWRAAWRSDHQS